MKTYGLVISTGFALFSMFFGSGNLVFPITLGQETGANHLIAALGIIVTGVIVPFLGVFGMLLYGGNLNTFFSSFGKRGTFIFSFLALALMGPFGVMARCLTVSHGALMLIFPGLSLPLSSLILCALIFLLTMKKNKIVTLLGSILTPFLLLSIAAISCFGLWQADTPNVATSDAWEALKNGIFQGYQTMDLLAAFFFSQFIINHLRSHLKGSESQMISIFSKASVIGVTLLSTVYLALVMLGAYYSEMLADKPPQEMLGLIALASLGSLAAPCVCLAIVVACVTTAIVLVSLFAEFLRSEVTENKLNPNAALLITLAIGFGVSTLDFGGIAMFLGPLLETVYPALIVLTLVNIAAKLFQLRTSHWPFTLTILAKLSSF